jgi:hypothetical protein
MLGGKVTENTHPIAIHLATDDVIRVVTKNPINIAHASHLLK